MPYHVLLFDVRNRVAFVTINRPDKLNALNDSVMEELSRAVEEIASRGDIAGAIVTGAGPKAPATRGQRPGTRAHSHGPHDRRGRGSTDRAGQSGRPGREAHGRSGAVAARHPRHGPASGEPLHGSGGPRARPPPGRGAPPRG